MNKAALGRRRPGTNRGARYRPDAATRAGRGWRV